MFLNAFKNVVIRPKFSSLIRYTRGIRPHIKIAKEKFQISLDLHQFKKEEIRVKAVPDYVIIEGKLERTTKTGQVVKQFIRKFRLPEGCCPNTIKSELSSDGVLTITAPRKTYDTSLPCETVIPISYSGPNEDKNVSLIPPVTDTKTSLITDTKTSPATNTKTSPVTNTKTSSATNATVTTPPPKSEPASDVKSKK